MEEGLQDISGMGVEDIVVLNAKAAKRIKNKFTMGLFICMADNGQYEELKTRLGNGFALGNDKYL